MPSSCTDMTLTPSIDAVAPQTPVSVEFSWSANRFHGMVPMCDPVFRGAQQHAWPRHNKKPRHAIMSRRNSCRNSFLPPVWWQLYRWALAQSTRAKPKPSMPSRSRPRSMSSRSRPRSTDLPSTKTYPKRAFGLASGAQSTQSLPAFFASGLFCVKKSRWPNAVPSSTVPERGRCRALDHSEPGGIIPVDIQDRRCACLKLQSWPSLAPRSSWARARSTMPRQSRFRLRSWRNPFRPRNTEFFTLASPAQLAPVICLSSAHRKGTAC